MATRTKLHRVNTYPTPTIITDKVSWWALKQEKVELPSGATILKAEEQLTETMTMIIESNYKIDTKHATVLYSLNHIYNTYSRAKETGTFEDATQETKSNSEIEEYRRLKNLKENQLSIDDLQKLDKLSKKWGDIKSTSFKVNRETFVTIDFHIDDFLDLIGLKVEKNNRKNTVLRIEELSKTSFKFKTTGNTLAFNIISSYSYDSISRVVRVTFKEEWLNILFGKASSKIKTKYLDLDLYTSLTNSHSKNLVDLLQLRGRAVQGNCKSQPVVEISKDDVVKFLNLEYTSSLNKQLARAFGDIEAKTGWIYKLNRVNNIYQLVNADEVIQKNNIKKGKTK